MPTQKRFNFFIKPDEDALLQSLASVQNVSKAEVIRRLLRREKIKHAATADRYIIGLEIYDFCKLKCNE